MTMKFYMTSGSCSTGIHILLEECGLVFEATIVNLLAGEPVNAEPLLTNTCYSFVDDKNVVHIASVHAYDAKEKTFKIVAGSGGLSSAPNELEGKFAHAWARNIWADMLA
jgi:hypothetical protein